MSEEVSYSTGAFVGEANETVRNSLHKRGLFYHDAGAWQTARQRAESLQGEFEKQIRKMNENCSLAQGLPATGGALWELGQAEAMLASFVSVPLFKQTCVQLEAGEYGKVKGEIKRLRHLLDDSGGTLQGKGSEILEGARVQRSRIRALASRVQETLSCAEKEALLETTCASLRSLGYLLERKGNALRATREQSCLWVQASDMGELALDFTGLSGLECTREMKAVELELGKHGVSLKHKTSNLHGRKGGGTLAHTLSSLFPVFRHPVAAGRFTSSVHPQKDMGRVRE